MSALLSQCAHRLEKRTATAGTAHVPLAYAARVGSTGAAVVCNVVKHNHHSCRHQLATHLLLVPPDPRLLVVLRATLLVVLVAVHPQGGDGASGMDVEGAVGGDAIVLHEDKK